MASITTLTYTFNFTNAKNITDLNKPLNVYTLLDNIHKINPFVFYKLYNSYYFKKKDNSYLFNFLALLFAIFMVVGYSYNMVGDASLIFGNVSVFIISFLNLLGHFLLFNLIIHKLFYYIINFKDNDKFKKLCHKMKSYYNNEVMNKMYEYKTAPKFNAKKAKKCGVKLDF